MNFLRKLASPLSVVVLSFIALVDCGDQAHCEQLRQDTYTQRNQWAQCESDSDCVPLPGNRNDCTGVLTCPFPVNRTHQKEAELRLLSIGDDSLSCHNCAIPNCFGGASTICDPFLHQCVFTNVVLVDTGSGRPGGSQLDAGLPRADAAPDQGNFF